eukprot:TRINITY_DN4918_c0_g1_i1.p1 TRINITY_DN4918_c0_g1~~TRINITY_DN4918_c0_g1_i1.p1  ORF type:complete len:513 (+),score=175.61 TRINITY_DN4918_c0_g1_i1:500-2038(+)
MRDSHRCIDQKFWFTEKKGTGQSQLANALLHHYEDLPVISVDIPALFSNPVTKTLEESFIMAVKDCIRQVPAILFLNHVDSWWNLASPTLHSNFFNIIQDIDPALPLFLVAVSDCPLADLPSELTTFFGTQVFEIQAIDQRSRTNFFMKLFETLNHVTQRPAAKILRNLPKAVVQSDPNSQDQDNPAKREEEMNCLRKLRVLLRKCVERLHKERKYQIFFKPVKRAHFPNYYSVIQNPLDFGVVMDRVTSGEYGTLEHFLKDVSTIVNNAIQFNSATTDPLKIVNRAKSLQDDVIQFLERIPPELIAECERITQNQNRQKSAEISQVEDLPDRAPKPAVQQRLQFEDVSLTPERVRDSEESIIDEPPTPRVPKETPNAPKHVSKSPKDSPKPMEISEESKTPKQTPENSKRKNSDSNSDSGNNAKKLRSPSRSPAPAKNSENGSTPERNTKNPELIVDWDRIKTIRTSLTEKTTQLSVEDLLQLYTQIYQLIQKHSHNPDKSEFLKELTLRM